MVKKIPWLFLMLAIALSGCGTLNVAVERGIPAKYPHFGSHPHPARSDRSQVRLSLHLH